MNYDAIYQTLSARQPLAPLFPEEVFNCAVSDAIRECHVSDTVRAGLLLWNDDLDSSHTTAQGIETPSGSLWHAVMHRREGDAQNSTYWWNRTGAHPAFAALYPRALEALEAENDPDAIFFSVTLEKAGTWLPIEFVEACQKKAEWCVRLQHTEFSAFLDWCYAFD